MFCARLGGLLQIVEYMHPTLDCIENSNGIVVFAYSSAGRGLEFTVPSNTRAEPIKKLMSSVIADMKRSEAYRRHEGHTYKVAEYEAGVIRINCSYEYVVRSAEP